MLVSMLPKGTFCFLFSVKEDSGIVLSLGPLFFGKLQLLLCKFHLGFKPKFKLSSAIMI